jgi:hypothetical protein
MHNNILLLTFSPDDAAAVRADAAKESPQMILL